MSTKEKVAEPIMLRARITTDELRELKILSAQRSTPVADLVAYALLATYNLNGEKK